MGGANRAGVNGTFGVLDIYPGSISRFLMHFLMFYDFVPDYLERRGEFRNEHLALAWAAHDRGDLVLGGAFADPADGAVLLFTGDSPAAAERFAEADPYVRNGLVTRWRVRTWTTVAGSMASTPVKPG
jgi:uncharacterized protein